MKNRFAGIVPGLLLMLGLSGCGPSGHKSVSLTVIYGIAALLALLLLTGCCWLERQRDAWLVLLFASVLVVNLGYFCLSISATLSEALLANRIAYLGSVVLPMGMFMSILRVTDTRCPKGLPWLLGGISAAIFLVAASPGYLDIYYKEVSFAVVNGVSTLIKVYGSWHFLYMLYLAVYFTAMVIVIVCAAAKQRIHSTTHAVLLLMVVLSNIGVWLIEQLVTIEFEMLSISYLISELFLLGICQVTEENRRLKELVQQARQAGAPPCGEPGPADAPPADTDAGKEPETAPPAVQAGEEEAFDAAETFRKGLKSLTPKEHELLCAYLAGKTTREIMAELNIKENTLKFHSRNLYGKLGVASRRQLEAVYTTLSAQEKTQQ